MKKQILSALAFLLISTPVLQAQQFFEEVKTPEQGPTTFAELQYAFFKWSQENPLEDVKGWKYYQRWEQFQRQRANPDGSIADDAVFMEEALRYQKIKQQFNQNKDANSTWAPFGPEVLPPSPNPASGHGMGRINVIEFHPTDPNTFWVGVAQGGLWKTSNGGQTWTPLTDDLPILRISDVTVNPQNPDEMYIVVGDFEYIGVSLALDNRKRHTHYGLGVYKTTDGGMTWNPTGLTFDQTQFDQSLLRAVVIDGDTTDHVVAAGVEGVYRSTDAGATWTMTLDSLMWDLLQDPSNPQVLYASSGYVGTLQEGNAAIYKSTDFGLTWTELTTNIPAQGTVQRIKLAIAPSNTDIIYAVSCDMVDGFYALHRSTDAGATWTVQSDYTDGVNILEWFEGGGSGGQGTYDLAMVVDAVDADRVYVGGVNMWGSADGGTTWDGCSYWVNYYGTSIHADQHEFRYNPVDDRYYVCNDGGVMRTDSLQIGSWDDAGNISGYEWPTQWENISSGMQITAFYKLDVSQTTPVTLVAGAQDNSTFYFDGNSWLNVIGGDGMDCFIDDNDPNTFYGSWQYGNLARTDDGGQSFQYYLTDFILNTIGEEGEWTTPFMADPNDPGTIYAALGNLYSSNTQGNSWNAISNFPNMSGVGYPSPASAMTTGGSGGSQTIYVAKRIYHQYNEPASMWVTVDGGNTWNDRTAGLPDSLYFTSISMDEDDPMTAWVAVSGFVDGVKVFKTTDGGVNWENKSLNLPNVPVNCVLLDAATANHTVYLGTDLGVFYTSDDLTDWQLYGNSLPNVIVSDLELNRQEQKLYASTFGRGIWMIDAVVGIDEDFLRTVDANLYPNPNDGAMTLNLNAQEAFNGQLEVIDVMGRQVYSEALKVNAGEQNHQLNVDLMSGQYYLRLVHEKRTKVIPFVVQ